MKLLKFIILFLFVSLQSYTSQAKKINGVSFVASKEAINKTNVDPVVNVNANYAAIMPFGYIKNLEQPKIIFSKNKQWFGETKQGAGQYIEELQKANIKIMLKPQIWVWHGKFTGHIKMTNEADWKTLESTYTDFIMLYAALAQEKQVEMLCIGTELEQFVVNRPDFWKKLIQQIKTVYKGKLTYAANWDEFKRTPFWEQLDFIGIDAYFPINHKKTPSLNDGVNAWKTHKPIIKSFSDKYNKPILFTEFGYRSVDYSGKEPWESDRSMTSVNLEAQSNLTQALFDSFWAEDWFAGGFIWKWHHNYKDSGGENNSRYTPQNKPVEVIIKKQYGLK